MNPTEADLISVKTVCKQQVNLKKSAQAGLSNAEKHLVFAWKMWALDETEELERAIWDYADSIDLHVKLDNSLDIGYYSKIADYEKKNGEIIKAHFTVNGNYLGTIKQLGPVPVGYAGWFSVDKERFSINVHKDAKTVADFFEPNYNEHDLYIDEDDK